MNLRRVGHGIALHAALLFPLASLAEEAQAPGVVVSEDDVAISSQLSARIAEFPFREGEVFAKDDLLIAFDCARIEADRKEARATLGAAGARHRVNKELDQYGAIGKGDVAVSGAETGAAAARVEALSELMKYCEIRAPFAGRVAERMFDVFETPSEGDEVLRIISEDALALEIIAPSIWLRWLKPGTTFSFEVRETGEVLQAEVARLGAAVDPVSQTIDVVGRFIARPTGILPGMSGLASFEPATTQ